ncbi:MAG: pilus assembly protein TadG-related protein [Candidatus Dormibacter sp.]
MAARRQERGQAIVVVAFMAMLLFGLAALAFDLSLAMSDRRALQADADTAALAGAISYVTSVPAAHWVTMQYLQKPLGFTLPLGSCTAITTCPAGTYTTGNYTVTIGDPSTRQMDLTIQHTEPAIFASLIGLGSVKTGSSVRSYAPGPTVVGTPYGAVAATGSITVAGGGGTTRNFGNGVYAASAFGANNNPHSDGVTPVQTDANGTACPGNLATTVDLGGATDSNTHWAWVGSSSTTNYNVTAPTTFDNYGPTSSGPTFTSANYTTVGQGKDASGNWNPGIYNGVYPSAPGKLNPGVYSLINNTATMSFGALTNVTYTAIGTEDPTGAAAIVLDSSDTGAIDITTVTLNGIDDLHPQSYTGPRDPQGTHNFVFYGGNGATGYTGSINFAPSTNATLTGIFYMPKLTITSNGNPTFTFSGQLTVASMDLKGGGANGQVVNWVCGLDAVLGNPAIQGGVNR